jgi:hypothetical protein
VRRVRDLEFLVGAGFLLGPMIYVLTLPRPGIEQCLDTPMAGVTPTSAEPPTAVGLRVPTLDALRLHGPVPKPEPKVAAPIMPSFAAQPFMFVAGEAVILHVDAPADWARGELFEPHGVARYRAAREVDLDRLPGDLALRIGRSVDLYGAAGRQCTVAIERLLLVAQYDGWSLDGVLGSKHEYEDDWPVDVPREQIREALWASQPKWLIGELAYDSNCADVMWARDIELPEPTILTESERSNPTLRARLRAFRRSPAFVEFAPEFEDYRTSGSAWLDAQGETRLVELRFGEDESGCGNEPLLHAIEVRRAGEFEATPWPVDPLAVFDADLDGEFELLYEVNEQLAGWGRKLESAGSLARRVAVAADLACPC